MTQYDIRKILQILQENAHHAYLATSNNNQPFIKAISAIVEDDLSLWIAAYNTSNKIKQIQNNPRICMVFTEHPHGDKVAYVYGRAEIIENMEEKLRIFQTAKYNLISRFPQGPESTDFCLIKIHISKIEWRDSWMSGLHIYEPLPEE